MKAPHGASGLNRLWVLPIVLAIEYTLISFIPHQWFTLHNFRGAPVAFGLALIFFGRRWFRLLVREPFSLDRVWTTVHAAALLFLTVLQVCLAHVYDYGRGSFPLFVKWIWLALILIVIGSLLRAFLSFNRLLKTARDLRTAWIQALLCCVFVIIFRSFLALTWDDPSFRLGHLLQDASFHQVGVLLAWLGTAPLADPRTHVLGTKHFLVEIASSCSGIEGLALISVLMLLWIAIERNNLRIARVLILVPIALASMWFLNLVRLVILILIGSAGHPDVAINGFHSQAGWIFFNCVSFGFLLTVQQVRWFQRSGHSASTTEADEITTERSIPTRNPAAVYLLPFLAITAASLVSRSLIGQFEWWYPLRFIAALIALWVYRRDYQRMDWQFGLLGVMVGVGVATFWIALHYTFATGSTTAANGVFASELSSVTRIQRDAWLLLRSLNAVITVPIAEELAFRGFVARRFVSDEIESVPYARLSVAAVGGSAVVFGVLHGKMWLAGILSGIAFALVAKKRGRIGEAFGAHLVANLMITAVVLFRGDFALWS